MKTPRIWLQRATEDYRGGWTWRWHPIDEGEAPDVEYGRADVVRRLSAEVERLQGVLAECADDLECELRDRYKAYGDPIHPAMRPKFDRDMETVEIARRALARLEVDGFDELCGLINKGYIEEAASKARSLAALVFHGGEVER